MFILYIRALISMALTVIIQNDLHTLTDTDTFSENVHLHGGH